MIPTLPPPAYVFFELSSFAIACAVLWRAFATDRSLLVAVLAFYPATFVLEFVNIRYADGYYYHQFLWMLGPEPSWVPVCVVASWGNLLYAVVVTVRRLPLLAPARPLVAGLLAVVLDFAFDPVAASSKITGGAHDLCIGDFAAGGAHGVGFWVWCVPSAVTPTWFGIPVGNFFGWWAAIAAYVAAIEIVDAVLEGRARRSAVAQVARVPALWLLFALLFGGALLLFEMAAAQVGPWLVALGLWVIPVLLLLQAAARIVRSGPIQWVPLLPVLFTMPWCIATYILTGQATLSGPALGLAILVCAAVAIYAYSLPYALRGVALPAQAGGAPRGSRPE